MNRYNLVNKHNNENTKVGIKHIPNTIIDEQIINREVKLR